MSRLRSSAGDQDQGRPQLQLAVQPAGPSEPTGLVIDDGALAGETNQGWWSDYEDLWITPLIALQDQASRISTYQSSFIPWMFQTEDYARAVIKGMVPDISDRALSSRVDARIRRQELLTKEPAPAFLALVDESALIRSVGGSQVMQHQLKRIVEIASTVKSITLRVVPLRVGAYPGLDSAFTLLEFGPARPDLLYVENAIGSFYLKQASIVRRYEEVLRYVLQPERALDPKRSLDLIDQIGNSPSCS